MPALSVGVLGPLEVTVDGHAVPLTTGRLRTLLAALAMSAGRTVPLDRAAQLVWDDDLPAEPRRAMQTYVARLRATIGPQWIRGGPAGYLLSADPGAVDALRFLRLLDEAATDPSRERALLDEALSLWRGEPFQDVDSPGLVRTERPNLVERHLAAVERRIDLDLRDGAVAGLTGRLEELIARHPLRESLWVRLLRVLDRSGRPAEALRRYEDVRRRLADELGADPSAELRAVYAGLLSGKAPRVRAPEAGRAAPVPRQLPADIDGFVGREESLRVLDGLLDAADGARPVVISAIAGTAGVGKTVLAVHWAHTVAAAFPDGQLYVNLRGFAPSGQVMDPAEALRGFLDALGLPRDRIPADREAQAALYRSVLADKKVLIVLDNARDAEQVRPLLPGAPGCLAVVTSRDQLAGLVVSEGARPIGLDLLTDAEARELLAVRLGRERVAAEPGAMDAIVRRCARLPLALAVVAARAAIGPRGPLAALVTELGAPDGAGLDALDGGDRVTDVRNVFSWSYRRLSPGASRLFRLLGLHPGPLVSLVAAASLAGVPVREVRPLLGELARAHLVTEQEPGRFGFHDLLRAYAAELAETLDDDESRRQALRRALDHYVHSALAAAYQVKRHRTYIKIEPLSDGAEAVEPATYAEGLDWFIAEHRVLIAMIRLAVRSGFDEHAWQIAWTMTVYLDQHGHWTDWLAVQELALTAALRGDEIFPQAYSHRVLGRVNTMLGRYDEARPHFESALELFESCGDLAGVANTYNNLGRISDLTGRHEEAIRHNEKALRHYRRIGRSAGAADTLNNIGWSYARLGRPAEALEHCRRALEIYREINEPDGEANALDSLGFVHTSLGEYGRAEECFQRAIELYTELRSTGYDLARTLVHLGESREASGDGAGAAEVYRRSLAIFEEMGHADADGVRERLARVAPG